MNLLIIGDSFVEGVGATNHFGWAQKLQQTYIENNFVISGIGGDNIEKINKRVTDISMSEKYDIIILEVGINDSRFRPSKNGNEISKEDFVNGIKYFLDYFKKLASSKFFLLGLTNVNEQFTIPYKEDKFYYNKNILEYNDLIKEVALKYGAIYINLPPLNDSISNLSDGLHPSDLGHSLIFDTINSFLKNELYRSI